MTTVLLLRHGRTAANARGVLAGRAPGVGLDEVGREQVAQTAERLAAVSLAAVVSSPLLRCRQTARAVLDRQPGSPAAPVDRGLTEADYGAWQGRAVRDLAREALWSVVQTRPSEAVFPGGEAMAAMQQRAVAALARHERAVAAEFGPGAVWAAVSHSDIIKSLLADAQGLPFDRFQRIAVDPASVSAIRFNGGHATVLATNTDASDLTWLAEGHEG